MGRSAFKIIASSKDVLFVLYSMLYFQLNLNMQLI